jgi:hypothetical protein
VGRSPASPKGDRAPAHTSPADQRRQQRHRRRPPPCSRPSAPPPRSAPARAPGAATRGAAVEAPTTTWATLALGRWSTRLRLEGRLASHRPVKPATRARRGRRLTGLLLHLQGTTGRWSDATAPRPGPRPRVQGFQPAPASTRSSVTAASARVCRSAAPPAPRRSYSRGAERADRPRPPADEVAPPHHGTTALVAQMSATAASPGRRRSRARRPGAVEHVQQVAPIRGPGRPRSTRALRAARRSVVVRLPRRWGRPRARRCGGAAGGDEGHERHRSPVWSPPPRAHQSSAGMRRDLAHLLHRGDVRRERGQPPARIRSSKRGRRPGRRGCSGQEPELTAPHRPPPRPGRGACRSADEVVVSRPRGHVVELAGQARGVDDEGLHLLPATPACSRTPRGRHVRPGSPLP